MDKQTNQPVRVECGRCKYVWTYKGANPYAAPCPRCLKRVKLAPVPAEAA